MRRYQRSILPHGDREEERRERFLEQVSQQLAKLSAGAATPPSLQVPSPINPPPPPGSGAFRDHDHSRTGEGGNKLGDPTRSITGRGLWEWDISGKLGINKLNPQNRLHVVGPGASAQFARPDGDVSIAGWLNEAASGTNLYQSIDEVSPGDSDYIAVSFVSTEQIYRATLTNIVDPGVDTGHTIKFRVGRFLVSGGSACNAVMILRQNGGTQIGQFTVALNSPVAFATYTYTLTSGEASLITDYNTLTIDISCQPAGAMNDEIRCAWFELETTGSGSGTEDIVKIEGAVGQDKDWLQLLLNGGNSWGLRLPSSVTTHSWTLPGNNAAGVLRNNGSGTLSWDNSVGTHNLLSSTHPDTVAASPTRGDLIVANSTPAWARFAKGSNTQLLQMADGNDPGWADTLRMLGYTFAPQTPTPARPATGELRIFAEKGVNRVNLAQWREDGRLQWYQGMVGWNGAVAILPGTGTTPNVWGTALGTAVGTVSHPAPTGVSTYITSLRRVQVVTSLAANQTATLFENQAHVYRGNSTADRGGWYLCTRFALELDPDTSAQFGFCGLYSNPASIGNSTPENLQNIVGLAVRRNTDGGNGNYYIVHNDSAGAITAVDLGTNFQPPDLVQLELYCPPNGSTIYYRVMRIDDLTIAPATGSLTTNLPTASTMLGYHIHGNSGNGTDPAQITLVRAYLECDV